MSDKQDRVLLGEIGAAQGLKGEVRLRSYTQDPEAIARYGALEDEQGRAIEIERVRVTPKALIARIKGVTTREGAEALTHTKLYIDRARLPERGGGRVVSLGPDRACRHQPSRRSDRHRGGGA